MNNADISLIVGTLWIALSHKYRGSNSNTLDIEKLIKQCSDGFVSSLVDTPFKGEEAMPQSHERLLSDPTDTLPLKPRQPYGSFLSACLWPTKALEQREAFKFPLTDEGRAHVNSLMLLSAAKRQHIETVGRHTVSL
jgi:hypothetical protein